MCARGRIANKKALTLDAARRIIAAAAAEAKRANAPGGVIAVVDDGGNLMALEWLDKTFAAGANISIGKARTAVLFKKPNVRGHHREGPHFDGRPERLHAASGRRSGALGRKGSRRRWSERSGERAAGRADRERRRGPVTGGTAVDAKTIAPDEVRGREIAGGDARQIAKGDVIIVPAGTPHWFKEVSNPFLYYAVKARWTRRTGPMTEFAFAFLSIPLFAAAAEIRPGVPAGAPEAVVDLAADDGVKLVKVQWRYSDTRIDEIGFRGPGPDGQPTGEPVRTYDYTPHAGPADFDDSQWEAIDPATLSRRRSTGRLCFNWCRINITIPERVGEFATPGSDVVFETSLDDYAEIWLDGELSRAWGKWAAP